MDFGTEIDCHVRHTLSLITIWKDKLSIRFYGMFIYRCSNGGKPVVTNAYKTIKIHNSRCEFCRSLDPHHHRGSEMTNYHMEGLNSTLVLFSKTIVVCNLISISSTTYYYTTYLEETYFERNHRCHLPTDTHCWIVR